MLQYICVPLWPDINIPISWGKAWYACTKGRPSEQSRGQNGATCKFHTGTISAHRVWQAWAWQRAWLTKLNGEVAWANIHHSSNSPSKCLPLQTRAQKSTVKARQLFITMYWSANNQQCGPQTLSRNAGLIIQSSKHLMRLLQSITSLADLGIHLIYTLISCWKHNSNTLLKALSCKSYLQLPTRKMWTQLGYQRTIWLHNQKALSQNYEAHYQQLVVPALRNLEAAHGKIQLPYPRQCKASELEIQ